MLDYGDLGTTNPFTPRAEAGIKEEEDELDAVSTAVQTSEASTIHGSLVGDEDKENDMEWNHSTGWQAGVKRKADELDVDEDEQGNRPSSQPKRARII